MPDDDSPLLSRVKFIPDGDGADMARTQERVRVMEAVVGEFRGDLKEIKVAVQLILGQHLKTEKVWRAWELLAFPVNVIWWCAVGAGLMYIFALGHA